MRQLVEAYFQGPLRRQPAFRWLEPVLPDAILLVTGSHSIGMNRPGSDLDIELILDDEVYQPLLGAAGGPRGLWVHDEGHDPLVDVKVRPLKWLQNRLRSGDPITLWIYRHACVLQDPYGDLPPLLAEAATQFRRRLPALVAERYRDLRSAVTIEHGRDDLSRQVMLGRAVEAALILPLLARQEPYPYPKWQAWHLAETHPRGTEIVRLCHDLLSGDGTQPFRELRGIIDQLLIDAGYEESLVKDFWRKL